MGLELVIGNGGNAQSRFVSSGEGGLRETGTAGLRGAFHGAFRADVALTGEPIDPWPLLAGVNSPAKGIDTGHISTGLGILRSMPYPLRMNRFSVE